MGRRAMRDLKSLWIGMALAVVGGTPSALLAQGNPTAPEPAKQSQPAKKQSQPAAKAPAPTAQKPAPAKQAPQGPAKAAAPKPTAPKAAAPAPKAPAAKAPAPQAKAPEKAAAPPKATAQKPAAKRKAKPAKAAAKPGAAKPEAEPKVARRDPFESLIGRQARQAASVPAIAGKPGLIIGSLRLDGVVRAPNGMIAVVTNPQQRTYFLREGDQLYDGRVEKITMDSVAFHEVGKDAFGKPVERQVNKRIYPSPGEQQ